MIYTIDASKKDMLRGYFAFNAILTFVNTR